jgi:hypothetical protein
MGVDDWDLRLEAGEENDKLSELQRDGVEIENMAMLQQMGFDVERTAEGDFKTNQIPKPVDELQMGRGRGTAAPEENRQNFAGQPLQTRPSDDGGVSQGSPSSGAGTSLSQKNFQTGITPDNFNVVKKTLQSAIDFNWNKTKTVEQLRKSTRMTVRECRNIVKNEFADMKRWEDDEETS